MATPEELARAHRAGRRAALRRAHPDLGGTPEAFLAALADADRAPQPAAAADIELVSARMATVRRRVRAATTTLRTRLPHRVPGALRRFTL